MHQTKYMLTILAIVLVQALSSPARADERSDRERTKRIECLIELLASQNSAPEVRGDARRGEDQTITFPADYDRSLQVSVYLAVKELLAEEEAAMDLLLAHDGDNRYSFSTNSDTDDNVTVSEACQWIAHQKLLAYEPELHVITRSQFGLYPADFKEPFKTWWSNNKERGLATLQIEAIDATIKFMTGVDGTTAQPWHPEASRLPVDKFNRYRDANLQTLKAIRQYIVATKAPYRAKTLDGPHSCFFGLPSTNDPRGCYSEHKLRRFSRQEIQTMLQISDLRDTRVYQEAMEEGREVGIEEGQRKQAVRAIFNMVDKQMAVEEIAALLEVDVEFVRQVLKDRSEEGQ